MNKKGSLELSINAIVIIVLALTLLGLGLTFIRGVFSDITDTSSGIQDQVKEQILEDLRTGNKKLSFPVTEMKIRSGDDEIIALGIKNLEDSDDSFSINIAITKNVTDAQSKLLTTENFRFDPGPHAIEAGEAQVFPVKITTERGTNKGDYLFSMTITDSAGEIYEKKGFFVQIT